MSRKGENIYRRKDGRWEGRYMKGRTENGKAIYASVYAPTYQEAKMKLQKAVMNFSQRPGELSQDTFGQVTRQWLLAMRPQIKESSYVKYQSLVENHILPQLGEISLAKLTTDSMEQFVHRELTQGRVADRKGLSPKTVRDILSIIRQIFHFAEGQHYRIPCSIQTVKVKVKIKEIHVLTIPNRKKLEQFLLRENNRISDGILLSLYTGLRIGEICALRWEQILLDEGLLQIRYTLQRIPNLDYDKEDLSSKKTKIIVTSPKSSCSNRDIPLPVFMLERMKKRLPSSGRAFFLTGSCEEYVEPRTMNNYFKRILRQCGIPETNYHTLRHTFATRCIELNFDVKTLSEILGHSNVNITLNRYVHITLEQKRKNMDMLRLSESMS